MASKTVNVTIITRSDTEANFQTSNPVLAAGEMAISTDNNRFKVGDGVNTWSDLPYNKCSWNDIIDKPSADGIGYNNTTSHLTGDSVQEAIDEIKGLIDSGAGIDTTYTFANGTNGFTVTPSNGSAQTVSVSPSFSVETGDSNGQVKINGTNASVKGLGDDAYTSTNNVVYINDDIPEGAANLSTTATVHKITTYRNGFTIPYQMDNANDGGMLRVRGTSEDNCILEIATWDDSGSGETIQFNYYPTTSQVTPTYSVVVPKKSGIIALISDLSAYAPVSHSHNYAGSDSAGGPANIVKGAYTGNGGQQNPNYFGVYKVGFLMMNTPVNGDNNYKDWIIMDCYGGNDVGGGVAFGVNRQKLGAYIMRSDAARTSWSQSAELLGTHNYTSYCATANHGHGLLHNDFTVTVANTTSDSGWSMINPSYGGFLLKSIRYQGSSPDWGVGNYGSGIAFGGADTKGIVSVSYGSPNIRFAGGNGTKPVWWMGITGASGVTYNLSQLATKSDISTLQSNFQAGVDACYNACVAKGSTPASKSLSDVVAGIRNIPSNSYSTQTKTVTLSSSSIQPWTDGWYYGSTSVTFDFPHGVLGVSSISGGVNFFENGYAGPKSISGNTVNIGFTVNGGSKSMTITAYGY